MRRSNGRRLAKLEDDQGGVPRSVEAARAAQDKMKAEAIAADIEALKAQLEADRRCRRRTAPRHRCRSDLPAACPRISSRNTRKRAADARCLAVIEVRDGYNRRRR